jgi:hypothetical protein
LSNASQKAEKAAGGGMGEGTAGGVVDGDAPARHLGGNPARQVAIRRHQSGAPAGRLQCFTQGQRDGQRFLCRIGGLHQCDVFQSGGDFATTLFRQRPPGIGGRRGPERFAEQDFARQVGVGGKPVLDIATFAADRAQQLGHAELRMAGIETGPTCLIEPFVQPRQHHGALGQAHNHAQ